MRIALAVLLVGALLTPGAAAADLPTRDVGPVDGAIDVEEGPSAGVDAQNHTAPDAECEVTVLILQSGSCTDSWDQAPGSFEADWHSTFHDLWTLGSLSLTVRDGVGAVVFDRDCRWFAVTGLCFVQIDPVAVSGTWTMRLDARVDATFGTSSVAHGWYNLTPA